MGNPVFEGVVTAPRPGMLVKPQQADQDPPGQNLWEIEPRT